MFYFINLRKIRKQLILFIAAVFFTVGGITAANILYPLKYIDLITKNAKQYELDKAFVCAVIHAESKFKKEALSTKGAGGLMQITEPTAAWLASELNIENFTPEQVFEPKTNIQLGCFYLNKLLKQFDGDVVAALAAYNAGSGNVTKWLANKEYSNDGKTLKHIPFPQTRAYIQKINKNIKIYKLLLKIK